MRISPKPCVPANPGARRVVIRREGLGELALAPMRWGIRGDTVHGPDILSRPLTSVRAEVLSANPDWRRLLNCQRCVVPAELFFEWKRIAEVKTREYCMRLRSGKPMMLAGLWNRSETCGETFAYISCPSNQAFSRIHDRMPVMLDPDKLPEWLNPDATLEDLLSMLAPAAADEIDIFPVAQSRDEPDPRQAWLFKRAAA